jgi:lysophospholipase L1-like esterase
VRLALSEGLPLAVLLLTCQLPASGQLVQDLHPPLRPADCCAGGTAQKLADELADWNQLNVYREANERLRALAPEPSRVVFLGDSITANWDLTRDFGAKPYVNRGIGGQTTPQMLLRMFPDVIDLHPAAVVILAGTNDIAGNTGPETATMFEENVQAMAELAQHHGVKVILCTIPPVNDYTSTKRTERRPPADILALNTWLKQYAGPSAARLSDYYSALVDTQGMLKRDYSSDGLHPNATGYAVMAKVVESIIEPILR